MLQAAPVALLWMLLAMALASGAGLAATRLVDWPAAAVRAGVPTAFGLALGPFVFGMAGVIVLALLPGAAAETHRAAALAQMAVLALPALLARPRGQPAGTARATTDGWGRFLGVVLALWVAGLLADALLTTLRQNDALEYATVGRALFAARDIAAYPMIDPAADASGFFGPWTHPPLYVAQIHLANVLQGHADFPGLMRGLSAWAALSATLLIHRLGRMVSGPVGLAAAVLFIGPPIFVLGAGSSLIDPLSVSAMAATLAALLPRDGPAVRRGAFLGLVVGLGMWSHSGTVLLLPLALGAVLLAHGWRRRPGEGVALTVAAGAVAAAVAAWPYLRNVALFGSPVSDTPAVFALPSLRWDEYFAMARGLATLPDLVQYGILKGWFAYDAYGVAFWAMAAGVAVALATRPRLRAALLGDRPAEPGEALLAAAIGILAAYHAGMVASVALDIDLMVRNDRYILLILPPVALLGGVGLAAVIDGFRSLLGRKGLLARRAGALGLSAVGLVLVGQLSAVWLYRASETGWLRRVASIVSPDARATPVRPKPAPTACAGPDCPTVPSRGAETRPAIRIDAPSDHAHLDVVASLGERTPPDALVLALRPADMYYADRRMVSYLDERLLPFYGLADPVEGRAALLALGVTHVLMPPFSLPVIYNSTLPAILADPRAAMLSRDRLRTQIYELRREADPGDAAPAVVRTVRLGTDDVPWTRQEAFAIGGRRGVATIRGPQIALPPGGSSRLDPGLLPFRRDRTALLVSGADREGIAEGLITVEPGAEHLLTVTLEGDAYVRIWIEEYRGGRIVSNELAGDLPIGPDGEPRAFVRRFRPSCGVTAIRLGIDHRGRSWLRVVDAALHQLTAVDEAALVADGCASVAVPRVRG
jgi:hypothetical protein